MYFFANFLFYNFGKFILILFDFFWQLFYTTLKKLTNKSAIIEIDPLFFLFQLTRAFFSILFKLAKWLITN